MTRRWGSPPPSRRCGRCWAPAIARWSSPTTAGTEPRRRRARLGLPSHLTGSGMAFPWAVLRAVPDLGGNLVEDMAMGLELALAGRPPLGCPAVRVSSELPESDRAALGQRRRWEHGQLATLRQYGPRLVMEGLRRRSADL